MARDDAAVMDMMQRNPQMMAMLQQAAGGGAPQAAFEDPTLKALLDPIREYKKIGGGKFEQKDAAGALVAYQAAVTAAGVKSGGSISWPQVESLVFACRSNAALCLLHLGRPDEAVAECDAALAMPCANDSKLLSKVCSRKLQAILNVELARDGVASPPAFIDELRRRGCFDHGSANQLFLVEQIARLRPSVDGSAAERGFDVLTEHLVATRILLPAELDAATDRIAAAPQRDRALLRELGSLAAPVRAPPGGGAPKRMAVEDAICFFFSSFSDGNSPAALGDVEKFLQVVRWALAGGMHPAFPGSVDAEGGGYLVWALAFSFERSPASADELRFFIGALRILVQAGALGPFT